MTYDATSPPTIPAAIPSQMLGVDCLLMCLRFETITEEAWTRQDYYFVASRSLSSSECQSRAEVEDPGQGVITERC